jgi:putative hydrolase of the HAD superfamily
VVPALDALAHRPLGVITNGLEAQQRDKLTRTGIIDRFAAVVTSDGTKRSKPDPRIFHHAAAVMDARREHCAHVGDDWARDVEGATGAGFRAIWLVRAGGFQAARRGSGSARPAQNADRDVTTIESLLDLTAYC